MLNAIKLSIYIIIFFAQSMNSFTRVRDEITVPQLDTDETNVDLSDDSVTSLCHARCVAKCMDDKVQQVEAELVRFFCWILNCCSH